MSGHCLEAAKETGGAAACHHRRRRSCLRSRRPTCEHTHGSFPCPARADKLAATKKQEKEVHDALKQVQVRRWDGGSS